jgi:hypothetical protein
LEEPEDHIIWSYNMKMSFIPKFSYFLPFVAPNAEDHNEITYHLLCLTW